ncbi:MAG: Wzz/FepE/Etk N-terminal domain-containing protein [Caldilineaceae bacterium]
MTIQEYIRIIRRRGWIVVAAMLLAAIAAYGVSFVQKEMYRATVYVSTVPARPDWGLGNTAKDLMRNFALNLKTYEMAQAAIAQAKLDQDPNEFLSLVDVAPEADNFAIKIEARNPDGEVARAMALTLAQIFEQERTDYYAQQDKDNRIEVKIRSSAIGYDQISPKPTINALAGAVLGMLFGIAIVLVLTWLELDLLRTPAAAERALGLPVLAAIPATATPRPAASAAPQPTRLGAPRAA